jgi:hypothetical protein
MAGLKTDVGVLTALDGRIRTIRPGIRRYCPWFLRWGTCLACGAGAS